MRKLATIIFMFFVLGNLGFAQNNDFISYNKIINQAELAIIDSSYSNALKYYEKAFILLEIPKGKDLHNAAISSILIGEFDKTFYYFNLLVEKGVEKEYFENETFKPLERDQRFNAFLDSFDQNHKNALAGKNSKLQIEIEKMNANDQKLASLKNYNPSKFPEFTDTVLSNINRWEEIIMKYGFPDEDMIGIRKPYSTIHLGFLILHFYQIENVHHALQDSAYYNNPKLEARKHLRDIDFSKFDILELNKTAIRQGKFSPYLFANYQDGNVNNYGSMSLIQVDNHVGKIRYSGDREKEINTNRKEIGLESLQDYYKKIEFIQKITGLTTIGENETPEEYRERIKIAYSDTKEKFNFDLSGYSMTFSFKSEEGGDKFFEQTMENYK